MTNFTLQISKAWQILKIMYADPLELLLKISPTAPKEDVASSNIAIGGAKNSGVEHSNASKQSSKRKHYKLQ